MSNMRRREFITLLGTAVAWPLFARAQQLRRVGVLIPSHSQTDREGQTSITAFLDTFQKLGWTDGRNVRIEYRWGAGDAERTKAAANELVHSAADVIVVASTPALAELHRLTSTIPLVFVQVGDPVDSGFVASLARPGGNITGFQSFEPAMGGKWLGVLKEAAPNLTRAAVLFGSDSGPTIAFLHAAEAVAPSLGVAVMAIDVLDEAGMERSVAAFAAKPDSGLVVLPHRYTVAKRGSIIILAARHRLPAIYPFRIFAAEGGLISYGFDPIDSWRGAATYVDRILRGEKPGELPVQAPTKFELVVNLKTARALGLSIPPAFPLRADEVIE
jgi:putative tryptophan/tyrosine transport system substrate-binding protein